MLNGFLYQGDILIAKEKLNQDCNDEKFKKIFNLLYDENLKIDLFKSYNVEKIFELRILSVSDRYVIKKRDAANAITD